MEFELIVGLEIHAELLTASKMFCGCPVVDSSRAQPNTAVCPVCAGLPGVLPVTNHQAVAYALRVAVALECDIARTSLFARKNYFYPDLPKGYQISQYEFPLAQHGKLAIPTPQGEHTIRIRRVHLEEDTGKLTHIHTENEDYSLVDLNRAGVPLLEIVSEPDMHSIAEVRSYAENVRSILRYLRVNSGDMEKGVIRFEANVSIRPVDSPTLGTRVEIKNLNSFRALERSVAFEFERQKEIILRSERVEQETLGWDVLNERTYSQRSKEEAHDYRYFPEPDLPPLVIDQVWIERVVAALPELPRQKTGRFQQQYGLSENDSRTLTEDYLVADYYEAVVKAGGGADPQVAANWVTGELFGWMRQSGEGIQQIKVSPAGLAALLEITRRDTVNQNTAKTILAGMLKTGNPAAEIIAVEGFQQISDQTRISEIVRLVLQDNPQEVASYLAGKETLFHWFFGQVMRLASGQADPRVVRTELEHQLALLKNPDTEANVGCP